MRYRFVKEVKSPVKTYRGKKIKTGDVVEFDDFLSSKASNNPDFELAEDEVPEYGNESRSAGPGVGDVGQESTRPTSDAPAES